MLSSKMQTFLKSENARVLFDRKPNQAAIIASTPVGLAAAHQVIRNTDAVFLLEEEKEYWFGSVYPANHNSFWWYAFAWWSIREKPSGDEEREIREFYSVPGGNTLWIVTSGIAWGSLAGGATLEAWCWDGERASLVGDYQTISY